IVSKTINDQETIHENKFDMKFQIKKAKEINKNIPKKQSPLQLSYQKLRKKNEQRLKRIHTAIVKFSRTTKYRK
ncbi:hypothetical protein, partial [Wenyingzhuangia sp. 2_MG-2023]|uniref:hypothetical protein n=1 Tax=Wenyingzhuangia sp. 2_MG-2023 TaxID=3062639 RepID=UPI0026E1A23A